MTQEQADLFLRTAAKLGLAARPTEDHFPWKDSTNSHACIVRSKLDAEKIEMESSFESGDCPYHHSVPRGSETLVY